MKEKLTGIVYRVLDYLPSDLAMKIKVLGNVLIHNWTFETPCLFDINQSMPEEQSKQLFPEADAETVQTLHAQYVLGHFYERDVARYTFINKDTLLPGVSRATKKAMHKAMKQFKKKYGLEEANAEVAYYKHGSIFFSPEQREYVKGKIIIDAGAYIGDSVLVLRELQPAKIVAFEPSPLNLKAMMENLRNNAVSESEYELVAAGLDNSDKEILIIDDGSSSVSTMHETVIDNAVKCQLTSLDAYMASHVNETVGFIKADVEGAALRMIQGAEATIRRDRPILSIAVYHSVDEFLGIPQLLASWNLGYVFQLKRFKPGNLIGEVTLLAMPMAGRQ